MASRREFITALGSAAGWPLSARTQAPGKVRRIGVVCPISCETSDIRSFGDTLAALGYKDGLNVAFEDRSAAGDLRRLPALTGELVRENVDLLFTTFGTAAALAAKGATTSIPVVAGSAGDLIAAGVAKKPQPSWRQHHWSDVAPARTRGQAAGAPQGVSAQPRSHRVLSRHDKSLLHPRD